MSAVLFVLHVVILVLLWGLVLAAVIAVRHDVFGARRQPAPARPPARQPAERKPERQTERKPAPPARKPRDKSAARTLVVTGGPLAGTTLQLADQPVTIGRADSSTLVVADDYVSTNHARLVPRGDAWVLEDLGSTNGTFLDRERVTARVPVPVGTPIRIGKTVLELRR
jgi:pSer/pThr/pTyr-binding forkhead associated (FHA) protein